MQLASCYRTPDHLMMRDEHFGALLYDFDRRKLSFLQSKILVELLKRLDGCDPLGVVLTRFCQEKALPPGSEGDLARTLDRLRTMGFVIEKATSASAPEPAGPAAARSAGTGSKNELLRHGLSAPICLTWEITYACDLRCIHCLSSSPQLTGGELNTEEAKGLIDELAAMRVFYINVGGGEPLVRRDFFNLMEYCVERRVGVKFSTNGGLLDRATVRRIASMDYIDVQVSLDGATEPINDSIRGTGSFDKAIRAMGHLANEDMSFKINTVVTRLNFTQLDELYAMAASFGAQLRLTRLRPSGRGSQVWSRLHLTREQQVQLYNWLRAHPDVLTADSFFHLSPLGEPMEGLNMCGAGRVVCAIDPKGNVFACPFLLHSAFFAGNLRSQSFETIWRESSVLGGLREWEAGSTCQNCRAFDACHSGCHAVKFFNNIPLAAPDPECVSSNAGEFIPLPVGSFAHSDLAPLQ